ncbi:hypothetical protein AB751O23_AF_00060 [Chlamydiales bacterium SCGC AB-751-O23]|jgi:hypothetical protein|nr:hypothetical protein AB751O23_AF_00060 [Chlamydiales bacterium SCGC AB-751-O23]
MLTLTIFERKVCSYFETAIKENLLNGSKILNHGSMLIEIRNYGILVEIELKKLDSSFVAAIFQPLSVTSNRSSNNTNGLLPDDPGMVITQIPTSNQGVGDSNPEVEERLDSNQVSKVANVILAVAEHLGLKKSEENIIDRHYRRMSENNNFSWWS